MKQLITVSVALCLAASAGFGCSSGGNNGGNNAGGSGNVAAGGVGNTGQGGTANVGGTPGGGGASSGGSGGSTQVPGATGSPCKDNSECTGANAQCIKDSDGWPNGYCTQIDCTAGSCPSGSECFETSSGNTYCLVTCTSKDQCAPGYACANAGACIPACASNTDCDAGEVCDTSKGLCGQPPCTSTSCASGLKCDSASGQCIPDVGNGPPPGPGPDCTAQLPKRDCTGDLAYCGQLMAFDPKLGTGFEDYPLNGETADNQYRSFLRRDAQMLVKYAAAYVACKSAGWNTGNGGNLMLGDMSEADGSIPGTSIGQPGHPAGTHEKGLDIDMGYFQAGTTDNKLRPICNHMSGSTDAYHCVAPPDHLDLWRDTLFLGALMTSEIVRVIGVDGQVGPLVEQAAPALCAQGWLPQASCTKISNKLAYETTDQGYGWFLFHHHHQHLSTTGKLPVNPNAIAPDFGLSTSLAANRTLLPGELLSFANVPGEALITQSTDLMPIRLHKNLRGLPK